MLFAFGRTSLLLLFLVLLSLPTQAAVFCVGTATELQSALSSVTALGADDSNEIRIRTGSTCATIPVVPASACIFR